jgi:chemotaxis protein methyltransferase CheR
MFQKNTYSNSLKQKLLDLATNNETLFFRDPIYFTAIENFVAEVLAKDKIRDIKIWSAASSTGQEAISIAMTMDELVQRNKINSFTITATDICEKALAKSKAGLYTEFEVMRGLSQDKREKYFTKEGDQWRIRPSLHAHIRFGYNNLIRSSVYDRFHLILCRNVLIYQKVHQKKVVIDMLLGQLEANGALLLGAGETVVGLTENVQTQLINNVSFYRRNTIPKAAAS